MKPKLLIFHRIVAPYRIDYFNALSKAFDTRICLFQTNLLNQQFDYSKIIAQLQFAPKYLLDRFLGKIKKGIWKEMINFSPDVILVSECGQDAFEAVIYRMVVNRKCRIVSMIDDSYEMAVMGKQSSALHSFSEKLLFPLFDEMIFVEPRVASHFKNIYGKGLFFPIIQDDQRKRETYSRLISLSNALIEQNKLTGKKILLYVGRLAKEKNVLTVIEAFKMIQDLELRFVIIGSGDSESQLKVAAASDNRIVFLGRKEADNLYAWYNIAQLFILPSIYEPFGAVTNEALLGGCYCLISDKAGSQCLIKNGVNGDIIDCTNAKTLSEILLTSFKACKPTIQLQTIRENKMNCSFETYMSSLINDLRQLTQKNG